MPFGFLNPALLLGLIGTAVPVLVHLLGRRRAKERRFPAIEFLLASEKRLAARRKLRNLLLLLARATLVAAVAVALARPLVRGAVISGAGQPVSAVLVLDRTASMGATVDGEPAFDRARRLLIEAAERLPAGSEACVVALERRAPRLTQGFLSVPEAVRVLRRERVGFARGTVAEAMRETALVLESARRSTRVVFIASDLRSSSWPAAEGPSPIDAKVMVLDAATGAIGHDVAIVGVERSDDDRSSLVVEARSSPGTGGGGGSPPLDSVVRLLAEGSLVNRGVVDFRRGGAPEPLVASTVVVVPLDAVSGAELSVELTAGDALAANDRWFVYAERSSRVRVLVADGAPSPNLYKDEVFYLQRALEAEADTIELRIADATEGELPLLEGTDVVVLANVARLQHDAIGRLTSFAEAGGGLLITVGDRTEPSVLALLEGLLPAVPRAVVSRRPGEPPIRIVAAASALHPVVAPFDSAVASEALESAVFHRVLSVDAAGTGEVVLSYSTGLPALVEARRGQGRIALLTTTVDRDWTDLPVKPAYLPLLTRIVLHLGRALEQPRVSRYRVGDHAALELAAGDEGLRIEGPEGRLRELEEVLPGRLVLEETGLPGPYRAYLGEQRAPRYDLVVNVDPGESDLARVSGAEVEELLGSGVEVGSDPGAGLKREDEAVWPVLLVAVAAFLLESLLGRRRSEPARESGVAT